MRFIKISMLILILISTLFLSGCGDYSEGTRTGEIIKFSEKGFIWKTWEGQLALTDYQVFNFSLDAGNKRKVDNGLLAAQIRQAMDEGKRVRLHYKEEIVVAPWRASTSYIIVKIDLLD